MATSGILSVGLIGVNKIDSLLNGMKWQERNLTFSFMTGISSWSGYATDSEPYSGFRPFTGTQQNAGRNALAAWANVCNLTFTEVTEPGNSGVIRFGYSSLPTTSWAYFPDPDETGGDVWFGTGAYSPDNPVAGNYDYMTYLHEIGHTLGLKHPHETSWAFPVADSSVDSMNYSVMSYRSYTGDGLGGYSNANDSYAQTPMIDDIAAVQYLYGANYNYNSGDTVYKFTLATGKIFQTIWDGGGKDTYDLSAYTTGVQIDLNPGAWSTFSKSQLAWLNQYDGGTPIYAYGNVANSLLYDGDTRSLIENVIGGSGNDILIGNQADNILKGGAGADTILGGVGDDTVVYDVADTIDGGEDRDLLDASSYTAAVKIDLSINSKLKNIEDVKGGKGADKLVGNIGDNVLIGSEGNDILDGGKGNDLLNGGAGNDQYIFGIGYGHDKVIADAANLSDTIVLGKGITASILDFSKNGDNLVMTLIENDSLTVEGWFSDGKNQIGQFKFADGSVFKYTQDTNATEMGLQGSVGKDFIVDIDGTNLLVGLAGNDIIYGCAGNDVINGGAGADTILGGVGDDTVVYDVADTIDGGEDRDLLDASSYTAAVKIDLSINSKLKNIEDVKGGKGADKLVGNIGDNVLIGSEGNDILDGGKGNDILNGGAGNDQYIFGIGYGHDKVIADAANLSDTIALGKGITASILDFINNGDNLIMTLNESDSLTVEGWFSDGKNQIGQFRFADGSIFKYTQDTNAIEMGLQGAVGKDLIVDIDGTNLLAGLAGNDIIYGCAGNDVINGGAGADTILGGVGNDTIVYDAADTVDGGADRDLLDASVYTKAVKIDLRINSKLKSIEDVQGGKGADKLVGSAEDNTLYGNDGNDTLDGGRGNDILWGGSGSDKMIGGDGNDIIDGWGGNDILYGGAGDDVYLYRVGSGHDIINSYEGSSGNGFDTIQFQELTLANIEFTRDRNDMVCTVIQTGETVRFTDWILGGNYYIDQFQFADKMLTAAQVNLKIT